MKALDLKLLRDLWRLRGQVLAIALVIAAAAATFVLSEGVHRSLVDTRDAYYARNHFGDVFAEMKRAPRSVVERAAAIPGVRRAEGRITQYATLEFPGRIEPVRGVINSVEDGGASELNRLIITSGRGPRIEAAGEVVVDGIFAAANDLAPGGVVDAIIYGKKQRLRIVGIGLAPDYVWAIAPGELIPDERRFGIFWMGRKALEAATDRTEAINALSLTLDYGASEPEVVRRLDVILAPYGGTGAYGRADHPSDAFLDNELIQLKAMTTTIPPIFLVVSTFLVYVVLGRMIRTEREQIGLMKAFGYHDAAIVWHYLKFALAIAVIGIVIGWAGGVWMGRSVTRLYAEYYRFPFLDYRVAPSVFAKAAALAALSAMLGAFGGVRSAAALAPAVAMAPPPPVVYRSGLFERIGRAAGLTPVGNMILRHIVRWPARSTMTVFGTALSLGLLFATMQFNDAAESMLDNFFYRAQRQDMTVTFIEPQAATIVHDIARLPGVIRAEVTRAAPVRLRRGHLSERVAIESAAEGDVLWARIDADGREVALPPAGLMLSRQLAVKLDADVGDSVDVELLGGRRARADMTVASIIDEVVGQRAYAEAETLERLTRDNAAAGAVLIRIDPAARADILQRLQDMPITLGVTERGAAMQKFGEMVDENVITMVGFYVAFASAIVVGVVYNSARIIFSERARELATLRVLGYHRREVAVILLGEVALLVAIALPLGSVFGYWLAQLMTAMFSSDLFRLPMAPRRSTYGFAVLVVLAAAAITALVVSRRVLGLDMVRVLKARD